MGFEARKPDFVEWNNKGADQPVHPRSLIRAFAIHILKIIMTLLATHKILIYYLVFVAEQTGLSLTLSETQKKGFLRSRPIYEGSIKKLDF